MRATTLLALGCALGLLSTAQAAEKLLDKYAVGKAITHENLTVFPVQAKQAGPGKQEYVLFSQASKQNLVAVSELGEQDARVSEVLVANRAEKPLLIMGGEVILGGKQDRVVQTDVVIPAKQEQKVAVFCVEHGRWSGQTTRFNVGGQFADLNVRRLAQKGDQGKVWQEVSKKNAALNTANSTDTYRQAVQSGDVARKTEPYSASILKELKPLQNVVGLIVAIDGKPIAIDIFQNPLLFENVRDQLVSSYAMEAVARDKPLAKAPSTGDVQKFVSNADQAEAKKRVRYKAGKGQYVDFEDDTVEGSLLEQGGVPVRKTYYSK